MKHIKLFENSKGKIVSLDKTANLIAKLNPGKETEIFNGFEKFKAMKNKLILELNTKKLEGNTTSDLGNVIGQNIYKFLDNDNFSEEDFISGFEHGVDSMKPPKDSKWHNF